MDPLERLILSTKKITIKEECAENEKRPRDVKFQPRQRLKKRQLLLSRGWGHNLHLLHSSSTDP